MFACTLHRAIKPIRFFKTKWYALLLPLAVNDACSKYKTLNAGDRLESFTGQSPLRCDRNDITPGWYRFTGAPGNPQMPTQCVNPTRRCGTHAPGWLDGQHPSVADGEVTRQVCYHWSNNCCRWKNNIKVKNCGAFYVYELQKTPACSLRYCGECQLFINTIVHIESILTTNISKENKIQLKHENSPPLVSIKCLSLLKLTHSCFFF